MASARAKSLALRASARSSNCSETKRSSAVCSAESAPAPRRCRPHPLLPTVPPTDPNQAYQASHAHSPKQRANFILRNIRINTIGKLRKQRVARTNRRENRSGGAGNINIVIYCATKSAGSSSAETETISSRDGCPPTAAPARSMKFHTRSYADHRSPDPTIPTWNDTARNQARNVPPKRNFLPKPPARTSRCPATSTSSHPWR